MASTSQSFNKQPTYKAKIFTNMKMVFASRRFAIAVVVIVAVVAPTAATTTTPTTVTII